MGRLPVEPKALRASGQIVRYGGHGPQEERWPAWKSALFVVAFCGAFWAGVAYLASRLVS